MYHNIATVANTLSYADVCMCFPSTIGNFEFSPPYIYPISEVDIMSGQLTFTWSPVALDCPAIQYNISASNCGSCSPTITNHTNVTCTDVPTHGGMCILAIQTVVQCGSNTEILNDTISAVTFVSAPYPLLNPEG